MRKLQCFLIVLSALVLVGCASSSTVPSAEVRQVLAPTGKLRVGLLLGNAVLVTKDPTSGDLKGIAVDLGRELARRVGVPFEPVGFNSVPALVNSASSNQWDVAFLAIDPARATVMDFTAPFMEVEVSYLVPAGSAIRELSDIDKPGLRVAVPAKSAPDLILSRTLKNATLVRDPNAAGAADLVRSGNADAFAENKQILFAAAAQLPGARVLDGRFSTVQHGVAIVKGRDTSTAYVKRFIEESKADGSVKAAIDRAALRGVVVAPLQ